MSQDMMYTYQLFLIMKETTRYMSIWGVFCTDIYIPYMISEERTSQLREAWDIISGSGTRSSVSRLMGHVMFSPYYFLHSI